ncbi:MAG: tagatose-bisphosphate aldolase [Chloroflexi bacterium]|nr:MAG: tagatose-bisphosphate aldolase [Chloroflexota bacterium]
MSAQKRGEARGVCSVCSANRYVVEAAILQGIEDGSTVLIEATCNQVNQFGGYTGMTPADFVAYVRNLAVQNGFSPPASDLRHPTSNLQPSTLLLGGDHLGPSVWQNEPAACAMPKAETLVRDYVRAGFTKIHLDCSMPCADDKNLPVKLAAERTAQLAKAAETAPRTTHHALSYVIGTEVPIPGGAQEHEEGVQLTSVADVQETIVVTRAAFLREGLESAWERVIAVVIQPGVEFGDDFVLDYDPAKAAELACFIDTQPNLVYEAHSTDYQTRAALKALVRDHFAILKVGPALTFAFREAVFALALMENELLPAVERSNIIAVLEDAMLRNPGHWQKHYHGSPAQQAFARKYSLSDRLRYYWPDPQVQVAFEKLLANLGQKPLPFSLLSQFAPREYAKIRNGGSENNPHALILSRIDRVLSDYNSACS